MKSLELAKQMLEEAGYKVTPPEEKFIPYKGQLVEATEDGVWYVTYFVELADGCYICSSSCDLLFRTAWKAIRPLSNKYIKQFKPWAERGDYNGPANVLLDDGRTTWWPNLQYEELVMTPPIAFEPLEK